MSSEPPRVIAGSAGDALTAHMAECSECEAATTALAILGDALRAEAIPAPPSAALLLARARPELARWARRAFWRRTAAGLAAALLPLPLVVAVNAAFVLLLSTVLATIFPSGVVEYFALTYAAFLVLLLASTYAAIPVLVERSKPRPA